MQARSFPGKSPDFAAGSDGFSFTPTRSRWPPRGGSSAMTGKWHFRWMACFAALFGFRVVAQAVQRVHELPYLPPFDAWHGGVLPYPLLLASQIVIFALLIFVLRRLRTTGIAPARWRYRACFALGGAYFAFMFVRLAAGLTVFADHPWFSKTIPAFFHLVLAGFLLLLGHYFYSRCRRDRARHAATTTVRAAGHG